MRTLKGLLLIAALSVAPVANVLAQGYNPDEYVTNPNAPGIEIERSMAAAKVKDADAKGGSSCNGNCSEEEMLKALQDDINTETGLALTLPCAAGDCSPSGNHSLVKQSGASNVAQIVQAGTGNVAVSSQYGSQGSTTYLNQDGNNNVAGAWVGGDGNLIELLQNGNANVFGAWLTGSKNSLDVEQTGDENVYLIDANRSNYESGPVVQSGQGNVIIQHGTPETPVSIEQRGGAHIIIDHRN